MFTSIRQHLLSTPTRHHSTAAGVPTAITNLATFKQHLASRPSSEVVLCQLHATWCQPCKMMTPVLKRVVSPPATGGASAANNVSLVMVDVDEVPDVAAAYRITALPTVVAFKAGQELGRFMGVKNEQAVRGFIAGCQKS